MARTYQTPRKALPGHQGRPIKPKSPAKPAAKGVAKAKSPAKKQGATTRTPVLQQPPPASVNETDVNLVKRMVEARWGTHDQWTEEEQVRANILWMVQQVKKAGYFNDDVMSQLDKKASTNFGVRFAVKNGMTVKACPAIHVFLAQDRQDKCTEASAIWAVIWSVADGLKVPAVKKHRGFYLAVRLSVVLILLNAMSAWLHGQTNEMPAAEEPNELYDDIGLPVKSIRKAGSSGSSSGNHWTGDLPIRNVKHTAADYFENRSGLPQPTKVQEKAADRNHNKPADNLGQRDAKRLETMQAELDKSNEEVQRLRKAFATLETSLSAKFDMAFGLSNNAKSSSSLSAITPVEMFSFDEACDLS